MFQCSSDDFASILGRNFLHQILKKKINFKGVTTDSRKVKKGNLYIPLVGENFDGHHFIKDAIKNGAAGALTQHKVTDKKLPLIAVKDTLQALTQLAAYWRLEAAPKKVIGLTGSNGKTSTKEFVYHLLKTTHKTYATSGNLNNHIGVPLTLLNMPKGLDVAIIEMGMNHLGEIKHLAEIARPHWGVITGIGEAHVGEIGGFANVAKAKCELIPQLGPAPRLFVGVNHRALVPYLKKANMPLDMVINKKELNDYDLPTEGTTVTTFERSQYSLRKLEITYENSGTTQTLKAPVFGLHYANNLLLAIRIAERMECSPMKISKGISNLKLPPMRSQVLRKNAQPATWILDCYNANPQSLTSLFETLQSLKDSKPLNEKLVLVLGDMKELGDESVDFHRNFAPLIWDLKPQAVYTIGDDMQALSEALLSRANGTMSVEHMSSIESLKKAITKAKRAKSIIALKGSRGMALEKALPKEINSLVK